MKVINKVNLSGRFKLLKRKGEKKEPVLDQYGKPIDSKNLVLDQYINYLNSISNSNDNAIAQPNTGGFLDGIAVGTGTTPPLRSDSTLENEIARSTYAITRILSQATYNAGSDTVTHTSGIEATFDVGAVVGNISEVGALYGSGSEQLMTRALIKDSQGNPTTISIGPEEQLVVEYYVDINRPGSVTETVDFNGSQGQITHTLCLKSSEFNSDVNKPNGPRSAMIATYRNDRYGNFFVAQGDSNYGIPDILHTDGSLPPLEWTNIGDQGDTGIEKITALNTDTGVKTRIRLGLNVANYPTGLKGVAWDSFSYGYARVYVEFPEALLKTENDFLEVEVISTFSND